MQFSLLNFPVKVQPFFFITMLLLGMRLQGAELIAWVLAGFLHILCHELGHALVARWYGMKPRIELVPFGGLTIWEPIKRLSFKQDLLIALAGPAAGAISGAVAFALLVFIPKDSIPIFIHYTLWQMVVIGIFWSVLNLLPIKPLDGYSILDNLIAITKGHKQPRFTLKISFIFAVLGIAAAVVFQQIFLAAFLGFMAWQIKRELDVYR